MEIVKLVAVDKRDTLAVLPTGFGKSLIYQILAPFSQFMDYGHEPAVDGCSTSIVLVISPLNALIRDQVTKLRSSGLKACILKADRVAFDDEDRDEVSVSSSAGEPLENLKNYKLIFAHPEALVENKRVMKILKTEEFQTGLKAIVVDEAHLVVDWYVNVDLYIITNKCEKLCHVYCLFHYLNNNNTVSR